MIRNIILIMIFIVYSFASDHKKILFISSYDLSFPTVKMQLQGIQEVLDEKSYQLDIEFMDTKRLDPEDVEFTFFQLLNIKKELLQDYDAILVGDDNALHFVSNYQNAFFYKKPIIFFAVKDALFAKDIAKNKYITGVIAEESINETIELIHKIHPNEEKITTIIDNTIMTKEVIHNFDKKTLDKIDFLNISNYSFYELERKLKSLSKNKPLLYISAFVDKNSEKKDFYNGVSFIKKFTSAPIYYSYEYGIGEGLIGGKVVLYKEQGRKAATILTKVLHGTNIETIEVTSTQNKFIFDYNELKEFNLLEKIPENSILINKPKTLLEQPLVDIFFQIIVLFSIILLCVIYLVLKLSKSSKKLKEKTVEQSTLLSLFDIGDTVLFKWNNDEKYTISHVSSNVENLLGFKKEEFLNNTVDYLSCIHKEDIQRVEDEVKENKNSFFRHAPYRLVTKDKKVKWVIDYTVLIKNDKNEITHYLGYLLDITKEKNIQDTLEKLIDSQKNMICLSNRKEISFANKKFYEFFKCNTIEEFQNKYSYLKNLFVENDRFFHLGKIKEDEFWMEEIQKFPENERLVAFSDSNFNICAFSVNSNKFDENSYLISFTDISETVLEQIKLEKKTIHDKLTGAYNREFFDIKYKSMIEECVKSNKYLAIAMLDIDYFKKINDNYGHDLGDYVLKELVVKINEISREEDILIRWGGEEFILVLKLKSIDNLFYALENIRIKIQNHEFKEIKSLTCSIGASIYENNEDIENTIKRADLLLYRAKEEGRNTVII